MSTGVSQIRAADLLYSLLQHRQIKSGTPEYMALQADERLRKELENLAESFDCLIAWYPSAIYLIPAAGNDFLGYSRSDMRKRFSSGEKADVLSLRYFIMLVLLLCFYDNMTSNSKVRPFIQLRSLMEEVEQRLQKAAKAEAQADDGSATYTRLYKAYSNLSGEDNLKQTSKLGLFKKVLQFMQDEQLITWNEAEEQIRTLSMLDDKVDFLLRNDAFNALFEQLKKGELHADA